jgi:hypothetical protein
MPHIIARLAFMQLAFTSALDFSYLTYENEEMGTSGGVSMFIIIVYGLYLTMEVVFAFIYRNYIVKGEYD